MTKYCKSFCVISWHQFLQLFTFSTYALRTRSSWGPLCRTYALQEQAQSVSLRIFPNLLSQQDLPLMQKHMPLIVAPIWSWGKQIGIFTCNVGLSMKRISCTLASSYHPKARTSLSFQDKVSNEYTKICYVKQYSSELSANMKATLS